MDRQCKKSSLVSWLLTIVISFSLIIAPYSKAQEKTATDEAELVSHSGIFTVYNSNALMWAQVEYHAGFRADRVTHPETLQQQVLDAWNMQQIKSIEGLITNEKTFDQASNRIPNFFKIVKTTLTTECIVAVDTYDFDASVSARNFIGRPFIMEFNSIVTPDGKLSLLENPRQIDCVNWDALADQHRVTGTDDHFFADINPAGYEYLGIHWDSKIGKYKTITGNIVPKLPKAKLSTFNDQQKKLAYNSLSH